MSIELVCPFCNFSSKVSEKRIPPGATKAVCPRCREKFEIPVIDAKVLSDSDAGLTPGSHEPYTKAPEEDPPREGSPWENRDRLGMIRAILATIKGALFSPQGFYKGLRSGTSIRESFAFGLLLGTLGSMSGVFWSAFMIQEGTLKFPLSGFEQIDPGMFFLVLFIVVPLWVAVNMLLYSGLLHLFLLMVRGGTGGFSSTFQVVAYSQAAQAWGLVPVFGSWVGGLWQIVVQIIGLKEIHDTSYFRIFIAFLLPLIFLVVISAGALVALLMLFFV